MLTNVTQWLQGKKTYLTAIIGLLTALVAWLDGQIDVPAFLAAVWVALQTCFIRAGIANEVLKAKE